jgi:hypothetical protein
MADLVLICADNGAFHLTHRIGNLEHALPLKPVQRKQLTDWARATFPAPRPVEIPLDTEQINQVERVLGITATTPDRVGL